MVPNGLEQFPLVPLHSLDNLYQIVLDAKTWVINKNVIRRISYQKINIKEYLSFNVEMHQL